MTMLYEIDFDGASPLVVYDASGNVVFDASKPTYRTLLIGTTALSGNFNTPTVVSLGVTLSAIPWFSVLFNQSSTWFGPSSLFQRRLITPPSTFATTITDHFAGTNSSTMKIASHTATSAAYMIFYNGAAQ